MSEKIYNMVEIDTIAALAEIVNKNELGEITIVDGGKTITVKGRKCPPPPPMMGAPAPVMPMPSVQAAAPEAAPAAEAAAPKAEEKSGNVVKAPIVGTFYASPGPGKAPFVTVGRQVKKGDVLMIIESMKLMNEIQSEFDGVVTEIIAKDGQAVEYDQPVMIIS
ncbi:MAG: acetyl-CoA carboxylase biotin carboxyl carrier protein [Oscillospiraceae bacterium]